MKKIIMLLVVVVLLTGCSANVNLTITSSSIQEDITITAYSDSGTTKQQVYSGFRKNMPVFANVPLSDTEPDTRKTGIEYYTRREQDLGSGYKFNYNYNYKFDDYKNARSVKYGFDSRTISKNPVDKTIMISTDSGGLNFFEQYPNLENVTINIKSPYKAVENNADYVNGNTYTWVLRKGVKKSIYLLLNDPNMPSSTPAEPGDDEEKEPSKITVVEQEEKEDSEFVKTLNNNPLLVGIIAILGFFLLVLILSKVSKVKS